mmetsp:Transcript_52152/g.136306  ORF Transcript_52152/g.136306 Transcript_52152/m.136306 type:complete len:313 (-) Transcript_52152:679-1617(-)
MSTSSLFVQSIRANCQRVRLQRPKGLRQTSIPCASVSFEKVGSRPYNHVALSVSPSSTSAGFLVKQPKIASMPLDLNVHSSKGSNESLHSDGLRSRNPLSSGPLLTRAIHWYYGSKPVPIALRVIQNLSPYLWPKNDAALKLRVTAAAVFLLSGKLVEVAAPVLLKHAIDALAAAPMSAGAAALPALLCFGAARVAAVGLTELRTAVFAPVTFHAIRRISHTIFRRMHDMDLSFHLARHTGVITTTLDRGTRAVQVGRLSFIFFPPSFVLRFQHWLTPPPLFRVQASTAPPRRGRPSCRSLARQPRFHRLLR